MDSFKMNLLFRKAEPCKEINQYSEFKLFKLISFGPNQYGFDVDVEAKKDFPSTFNPYVNLIRCNSYSDVNSCEYYTNLTINAGCGFLNMKNQVWSNIVEDMKLPCPIAKAMYRARNETLDASMFYKWLSNAEKFFWKGRLDLRHPQTKESMLCVIADFEFVRGKNAG